MLVNVSAARAEAIYIRFALIFPIAIRNEFLVWVFVFEGYIEKKSILLVFKISRVRFVMCSFFSLSQIYSIFLTHHSFSLNKLHNITLPKCRETAAIQMYILHVFYFLLDSFALSLSTFHRQYPLSNKCVLHKSKRPPKSSLDLGSSSCAQTTEAR